MLKPHIDLIADDENWRGDIGSYFNENEWESWFKSYGKYILKYAALSQEWGIE